MYGWNIGYVPNFVLLSPSYRPCMVHIEAWLVINCMCPDWGFRFVIIIRGVRFFGRQQIRSRCPISKLRIWPGKVNIIQEGSLTVAGVCTGQVFGSGTDRTIVNTFTRAFGGLSLQCMRISTSHQQQWQAVPPQPMLPSARLWQACKGGTGKLCR